MRKYRLVAKKGEGTFSEVLKAQNVKDGTYHAIKCMKNRFDSIDQVNNLREIQALRRLSPHEHIVPLEEVLYDQPTGRLALVFELMDANLYEMIKGRKHYLNPNLVKSYMWQLMKSLDHMHKKGIFHRDIKPENILVEKDACSEMGKGLKLADFGSCRGIYSKQPYTEYISTRWYRPPECLLTDGYYGPEMDLWGAGCVMFEITSLYPLFPGTNEVDQINRIHKIVGTPSKEVLEKLKSKGASHINFDFSVQRGVGIRQLLTHVAPEAIDMIERLLKYDAAERLTAREALRHPYFREMRELEAKRALELENSKVEGESSIHTGGSNSVENRPLNHVFKDKKKKAIKGITSSNSVQSTTDEEVSQVGSCSEAGDNCSVLTEGSRGGNLPLIYSPNNVMHAKKLETKAQPNNIKIIGPGDNSNGSMYNRKKKVIKNPAINSIQMKGNVKPNFSQQSHINKGVGSIQSNLSMYTVPVAVSNDSQSVYRKRG